MDTRLLLVLDKLLSGIEAGFYHRGRGAWVPGLVRRPLIAS